MIIIVTAANTLGDSSRDGRANLIVFLVGFFGEEPGLLQLILEGVHTLFIRQAAILENLAGALRWTHVERKSLRLKTEYINKCGLKDNFLTIVRERPFCSATTPRTCEIYLKEDTGGKLPTDLDHPLCTELLLYNLHKFYFFINIFFFIKIL